MKLLSVSPSTRPDKKMMAVFETDTGRKRTTHFGAKGMDDYTITGDKEQRERYRTRHKKDLATNDPTRSGFLSFHILWGDSKSKSKNIAAFKERFHL